MIFRRLNPLILLFLLFFTVTDVIAFEEDEAAVFANFIKSIAQTSQGGNAGVLCIFGGDEISQIIASERSVINLNNDPDKYHSCKVVYISNDKKKVMRLDIAKFSAKKILTIATFEGFTENGGMMQVEMGRRNFELTLNAKLIKESSIKLNSLVMELVIN